MWATGAVILGLPTPAAAQTPDDELAECEKLASLGRRAEAMEACLRAEPTPARPAAARAMVRAILSGKSAPTVEDLAFAYVLADGLRKKYPASAWGHAAMFDIAVRIGDEDMQERCSKELERVAPGDPEAVHAHQMVASLQHPGRVWAGWLTIALASLATLAHALVHALRRHSAKGRIAATAALAFALTLGAIPARVARAVPSQDHPNRASNWPVDDQDPESSIPSERQREQDPVEFAYWLQDLAYKATTAAKKGDHQAAIRFYTALVKTVPDRAVGYSRLCEEYEAIGERQKAIDYCKSALQIDGVKLRDYVHYVELVLSKPGDLNMLDKSSLSPVLDHMRAMPEARWVLPELECQLALKTDDIPLLERCTTTLIATRPVAPVTVLYEWSLAMKRGNYHDARWNIGHGRRIGMTPEAIARMEKETDAAVAIHTRNIGLGILAGLLMVVAVAAGIALLLRRREEPTLDVAPPVGPVVASGS